jgi:dihydrofolate reductase
VAKLIYSSIASIDGYVSDTNGNFDWAAPDTEVHAFINELLRPIGTHLYGRRMYETMVYWETANFAAGEPVVVQDFAEIWRAAEKLVYSTTLKTVASARTRIEPSFDPEAVRHLKGASATDLIVGGPHLAAQAIKAGLVDDYHLFLTPVVVGGGNHALPHDVLLRLELLDQNRFSNGTVHLHYRRGAKGP